MDSTKYIYTQIDRELARAKNIWGDQQHPAFRWITILSEELGEVSNAALNGDTNNYVEELIQLGAVVVAAIESYNKSGMSGGYKNGNVPSLSVG